MNNQECRMMTEELISKEEQHLDVGSQEFIQRHNKIMAGEDMKFINDLMMEQREGM